MRKGLTWGKGGVKKAKKALTYTLWMALTSFTTLNTLPADLFGVIGHFT